MNIPPEILTGGSVVTLPVLIYYSTKWAVNGLRKDVREIKKRVTSIDHRTQSNAERIATIEGKHG